MVSILALLLIRQTGPIQEMDQLARARDAAGMAKFAAPSLGDVSRRFRFLRQNGAYDTGRYGWIALSLQDAAADIRYVVFSTKLTSEDIGEQVFRWDGKLLTALEDERDDRGFRIEHHDFELWFDIGAKRATIIDRMKVARLRSVNSLSPLPQRSSMLLRMSPHYVVSSITDGSGRSVRYFQAGGVISVTAPMSDTFTLNLRYAGVVDLPGYAGGISSNEISLTNDYWYPMNARGAATYTAKIHGPRGWTAIAQGEKVAQVEKDTETVTEYKMDLPVCIYSLAVGPYKSASQKIGDITYYYWAHSGDSEKMRMQCELNAEVIRTYRKIYPYPFSRWGTLVSPTYGGGALEAYSFATWGGPFVGEDSHEIAHTWFGGILPNTYLKSLWNESFASFCESWYQREAEIGDRAERRQAFVGRAEPSQAYSRIPIAEGSAEVGGQATALGYGKGADVLQMLESQIGEEKMLKAMQTWCQTHPKGTVAEWEEFEAVVNKLCDQTTQGFFDYWLRTPGWLDFTISDVAWSGGQLSGTVRFAESTPYPKKGPILAEVLIRDSSGKDTWAKLDLVQSPQREPRAFRFSVPCATKPSLVSVDPWLRLLRRKDASEHPESIATLISRFITWVDPAGGAASNVLSGRGRSGDVETLPADLDGIVLVGDPSKNQRIKSLCERVGFSVSGTKLTYRGTTIDLAEGAALAVVPLNGDKRCVIAMGNPKLQPEMGASRLCLTDRYGRFLRGVSLPKTSGALTYRL